ncbi:MAG: glycosyltransferase family 2 protein [Terriglobales bacterium]
MDSSPPTAQPRFSLPESPSLEVSIIVPARNEEANIGGCLASLNAQTGVAFEIIVVDDASTDRTSEIAKSFAGLQVISAGPLPKDRAGKLWTGKNNALVVGAKQARAPWLLFTDADTVHLQGSLARVLEEARREQADLLSYSPEQVVITFAERAVMPIIFAELAAHYPLHKVRDQNSSTVAANGQYLLVRRAAYDAVRGHAAVAAEILEDVALARRFRDAAFRVYFRYGGDAVRTRMYRNWAQLREGWTKNLALLFPHPGFLAFQSLFWWCTAWAAMGIAVWGSVREHWMWITLVLFWLLVYRRIRAAHFSTANNLLAITAGMPMFAYLLLRSKKALATGRVSWKGRAYDVDAPDARTHDKKQTKRAVPQIENQGLRAKI